MITVHFSKLEIVHLKMCFYCGRKNGSQTKTWISKLVRLT